MFSSKSVVVEGTPPSGCQLELPLFVSAEQLLLQERRLSAWKQEMKEANAGWREAIRRPGTTVVSALDAAGLDELTLAQKLDPMSLPYGQRDFEQVQRALDTVRMWQATLRDRGLATPLLELN